MSGVDEARREADRRRKQSHAERDAFAVAALAGKVKDTETIDLLATCLLDTATAEDAKTTCRLLGIDPPKRNGWCDFADALRQHTASSRSTATRDGHLAAERVGLDIERAPVPQTWTTQKAPTPPPPTQPL